jgi:Tol biopolymer transport system component
MHHRLLFLMAVFTVGSYALVVGAEEAKDESLTITVAVEAPAGAQKIVTLDLSGRQIAKLLEESTGLSSPCWLADDRQLIFVSARSGKAQIHRIDADGANQTAFTHTTNDEYHPCCRPDGKQVAFASLRTGNVEVFVMDADGSHQTNLTNSPSWDTEPCWSPDGKQIAFISNRDKNGGVATRANFPVGVFHLWVMDADGTNARQLISRDLTGWVFPSWSPDGAQILFSDRVADGSWQIFVATVDGQAVEQLTEGVGTNSYASWSPDGRYIAYLHFERPMIKNPGFGRLMLYDTESTMHTKLGPDDLRCNGALRAWKLEASSP